VPVTRRDFVIGTAMFAAVALAARPGRAQEVSGPFRLDPLPYPPNALAPYIDARTMEIHHDLHHRAYVNGLNEAVKDHAAVAAMPLQDILGKLAEMPEAIRTALRNFGGGHANHAMFWQVMGSQPNQDTPLIEGKRVLFGNDMWEHAYYLTYKQRRREYLEAWWNVVNWPKVGQRYTDAKSGKLAI